MKLSKTALSAMIASVCFTGHAFAQQSRPGKAVRVVSYAVEDETQASPSDVEAKPKVAAKSASCDTVCDSACDSACDSDGAWKFNRGKKGCGSSCGAGGCDGNGSGCDGNGSGCGCGGMGGRGCGCGGAGASGIFASLATGWKVGGWSNIGYHSFNNAGTGFLGNGAPANFNNYASHVQLQQQWFWAEKVADGSNGIGLGGRIDYLYGTDAPDTQAFGTPNNTWDNPWDNGFAYGNAIPQLYGEVAYNDFSMKVGKFFTIIGNEVVQATGNFFYSRQFTFYNSEPFTHTGALTTYKVDDDTTIYNGYVLGWDSGFQDNGDAYIGGFKRAMVTGQTLTFSSVNGRFADTQTVANRERGDIYSGILTTPLTDKLTHLVQADYLFTNNAAGVNVRNTFGLVNYLIYQLNDKWAIGQRYEWYNFSYGNQGIKNADLYNYTAGLNYKPMKNIVFRPEVRWIWDQEKVGVNPGNAYLTTVFGTDLTFIY